MRRTCVAAFAAIILLPVAMGGSAAGGKSDMETVDGYEILEAGKDASFSERKPSLHLFTNTDAFDRFYTELHKNRVPVPEPPEADFDKNIVVYISFGRKNTGGFSIEVLKVFTERDTAVVKARLREPQPGSFQIQVLTHPYVILSITKGNFTSIDLIDERGNRLDSKSFR